jgi:hypothetical protein
MTERTRKALGGAGLVAAAAVALALGRCAGSSEAAREPHAVTDPSPPEQRALTTDGSSEPANGASPPPAAATTPGAASSTVPSVTATPSGAAAPPSTAASRINAALERDPKDLALFARIERELKRPPPPAVNAIVELRGREATRDELLVEARRLFADDFRLRALVVRWIDEVAPAPGGGSKSAPSPVSAGSGTPVVQPIHAK